MYMYMYEYCNGICTTCTCRSTCIYLPVYMYVHMYHTCTILDCTFRQIRCHYQDQICTSSPLLCAGAVGTTASGHLLLKHGVRRLLSRVIGSIQRNASETRPIKRVPLRNAEGFSIRCRRSKACLKRRLSQTETLSVERCAVYRTWRPLTLRTD